MKISFGTEISVSHERVDFEEPKASYEKREYEKTYFICKLVQKYQ